MSRAIGRTFEFSSKQPFAYRFTCEHCGQDSGWKLAAEQSNASLNVSGNRNISSQESAMLQQQAQSGLKQAVAARKFKMARGNYGADVSGKCESCGKHQSWEIGAAKWKPFITALQGLIGGFLLMIFASLFGKDAANTAAILIPIGLGAGLLIGLAIFIKIKIDSMQTKTRNTPEILWPEEQEVEEKLDA